MSDQTRLDELEQRLKAAKAKTEPEEKSGEDYHSMADIAWRMVLELVAGIAFGFGIGLGFDSLFGTQPIFLVLFVLFGFAGGISMMLRTAQELQERQARLAEEAEAAEKEKSDG